MTNLSKLDNAEPDQRVHDTKLAGVKGSPPLLSPLLGCWYRMWRDLNLREQASANEEFRVSQYIEWQLTQCLHEQPHQLQQQQQQQQTQGALTVPLVPNDIFGTIVRFRGRTTFPPKHVEVIRTLGFRALLSTNAMIHVFSMYQTTWDDSQGTAYCLRHLSHEWDVHTIYK